ncbi:MAG TPA: SH3 domain-containing protein [Thermomicrobiales bacterium]|nr:SH3 domain-containing protein [Thermomicrobiales bacterium]
MKLPNLSPLRLFAPAPPRPALAGAGIGGNMMFASGTGSGGGDDFDYPDDFDTQVPTPERRPRQARASRGGGGGESNGRQRTVQFQPEERYWTDYLRIALPVVGLLLMIGLLWFWAQQIIDDDPNTTEPNPTEEIGLVTTITPEPTQQQAVSTPPAQTDQNQQAQPTQPAADTPAQNQQTTGGDNQTAAEETPAPTKEAAAAGGIAVDTKVTVTEELNMRAEPVTTGDLVTTLAAGTELDVIGGPEQGEDYTWWQVVDPEGNSGWVVENFIEPVQ